MTGWRWLALGQWLALCRWLALGRWLTLALPLLGFGMPDTPAPTDAARDGVMRRSYPIPGTERRVSMLVKGDPQGRRVIFVHGTPGAADGWERYVAQPPPGVEMIAIDRPGFGASGPADALPSLRAQADAIAPLLVERAGHWPILVGHSLGGPIVAQVALDHPGRVGALRRHQDLVLDSARTLAEGRALRRGSREPHA